MADELLVIAGLGIPVAARLIPGEVAPLPGRVWLNINMLGSHIPQMYAEEEIHDVLDANCAPSWGMCGTCVGFGTTAEELGDLFWPMAIDELPEPCEECQGTGRPWFIVTVNRTEDMTEAVVGVLPHGYVSRAHGLPGITDMCLGCGEPLGHVNHQ
jgi:hypothetical protein